MPLVIAALLGLCAAAFVLYPLAGSGAQSASRAVVRVRRYHRA